MESNSKTPNPRRALVTGANSGIGLATAKRLKQEGWHVYLCGRNKEELNHSAQLLQSESIVADLDTQQGIKHVQQILKDTPLHLLVNCAGVAQFTPLESLSKNDFDKHFNINTLAPLLLTQALIRELELGCGCVCNISSVITNRPCKGFSIYAASKAALEAITKTLAQELANRKIRVNAISPGAIETPIFSKMNIPDELLPQIQDEVIANIPLGHLGQPEDVAELVLTQACNSYTTGAIWHVDGGVNSQ